MGARFNTCALLVTVSVQIVSAAPPWIELRFENISLYCHKKDSIARVYVAEVLRLEQLAKRLMPDLETPRYSSNKIFVFASESELEQIEPHYEGQSRGLPAWVQHEPYGNSISLWHDSRGLGTRFLIHEYFHVLADDALPRLPAWADEGLADFLCFNEFDGGVVELGRDAADYRRILQRDGLIPLEEFFAVDLESPVYLDQSSRSRFYAQAWLLTHYLIASGEDIAGSFTDYSWRIENGAGAASAFGPAFHGKDVDLLMRLEAHRDHFPKFRLRIPVDVPDDSEAGGKALVVREVDESQMLAEFAGLIHGRHPQQAELCGRYLDRAQAAGATDFDFRLLQIRHWSAIGQTERALSSLEELAASSSLEPRQRRNLAMARIETMTFDVRGRKIDEPTSPELLAARFELLAWLRVHPRDAWARGFFGSSFREERLGPFFAPIRSLEIASRAQPYYMPFKIERLGLLYRAGQVDAALELLRREVVPLDRSGDFRFWAELRLVEEALRASYFAVRDSGCTTNCTTRLDSLRPLLEHASAQSYLDSSLVSLNSELALQSQYRRYNAAVELVRQQRFAEADLILRALEAERLDAALQSQIEKFRGLLRKQPG